MERTCWFQAKGLSAQFLTPGHCLDLPREVPSQETTKSRHPKGDNEKSPGKAPGCERILIPTRQI